MKANVLGWKHSKGDFDGTPYNNLTIYLIAKMEQKETQRGSAGIEIRADLSLLERLSKMEIQNPIFCDVETELRATGKGQSTEMVVNITPIKS